MILGEMVCSRLGAVEKALVGEPYLLDDAHAIDLPCIDEVRIPAHFAQLVVERHLHVYKPADVVVSREVGSGVVPMDAGERDWRERHGVLLQELARRAVHVRRVFCGLTEELK